MDDVDEVDEGDDCCGENGLSRCDGEDGTPKKMSRGGCMLVVTRSGTESCCCCSDAETETDTGVGGEDTCTAILEVEISPPLEVSTV